MRNESYKFAKNVLTILFTQHKVYDAVILYAYNAFSYDIYTGDPFRGRGCDEMKEISIGTCTRGIFSNAKVSKKYLEIEKIPDEVSNDCNFKFCARVQEPFINADCKSGIEIQIMEFLEEEIGFKVKTVCSTLERGEKINNKWEDLLGKVKTDACDIIAGAFFPDYEVHYDFASTDFYLQDYYTFFVPKASFEPRWKGLLTIFQDEIWFATLSVFLVSWIFWYLAGIFSAEFNPQNRFAIVFMNVLATNLGISANNRPKFTSLRIFFVVFSIYGLILTTCYTCKLILIFTHPKLDYQIDSLKEILDSDLKIGGLLP
jgi:hypothetical protein